MTLACMLNIFSCNKEKKEISKSDRIIKTLIISHRGVSESNLENTIYSFANAISLGSDMIELDVRKTKDKVLVVFHDDNLKRIFRINKKISDVSYSFLLSLDLTNHFRSNLSDVFVPTLEDAIKYLNGKCPLLIDIKEKEVCDDVVQLIRSLNIYGNVTITSFDTDTVSKIKQLDDRIKIAMNLNKIQSILISTKAILNKLKNLKSNQLIIWHRGASRYFINKMQANQIQVWIRTVNTRPLIKKFIDFNVDGIITDYPERVSNILIPINSSSDSGEFDHPL